MDNTEKKLSELSLISKFAGQSEELVQAGGGNTSVKLDENRMFIKASGFQLSEVTDSSGYSLVSYKKICDIFEDGKPDPAQEKAILDSVLIDGKRPSIETFLHSVTSDYTIHTHPLGVSMLACRKDGMDILKELFPDSVTVGYDTPGIRLANIYFDSIKEQGVSSRIFLKNHGLIISADSAKEAIALTTDTIVRINDYLGLDSKPYLIGCKLFMSLSELDTGCIAYYCESEDIRKAIEISGGAWDYEYSPDCVVYCSGKFLVLNASSDFTEEIKSFTEKYGLPKVIIADGLAFTIAPTLKKAKDIESVLRFTARIFISESAHDADRLDSKEIGFLLNWDSEKYRSSL